MLISPARKRYLFDGETFGTISLKSVLNSNVCTGGLVTASNNQVFGVLIFNFQRQYFSIWITFAKNFTYFEIYSFSNKKKKQITSHWPFLVCCNATYFGIRNRKIIFCRFISYQPTSLLHVFSKAGSMFLNISSIWSWNVS